MYIYIYVYLYFIFEWIKIHFGSKTNFCIFGDYITLIESAWFILMFMKNQFKFVLEIFLTIIILHKRAEIKASQ